MEKLTEQQDRLLGELLTSSPNEETTQFILRIIGENNWTRGVLSNCETDHLTIEQEELFESLGGGYSFDGIYEELEIENAIREQLKSLNATSYLYDNSDYLSDLREGKEIYEGIDVEEIKNRLIADYEK